MSSDLDFWAGVTGFRLGAIAEDGFTGRFAWKPRSYLHLPSFRAVGEAVVELLAGPQRIAELEALCERHSAFLKKVMGHKPWKHHYDWDDVDWNEAERILVLTPEQALAEEKP